MNRDIRRRARFLGCTALIAAGFLPTAAWAQEEASEGGLAEIVVTAQKREQSLQDVPIAVTAITEENLQANRITTVNDLSAIAPGVTVRPSAGGIQTPFFTIRGSVSTGVVAGQDKTVSIYLDGVYLSSPRGSIFDLPDVARLEVLRGPQGTLFGRNATGGAVSVVTKDPSGDARVKLEGTIGNYDAYRFRATVETPEIGPFSALFSYVRNYRRGEIENTFPGLVWDRTNSPSGYGKSESPRWLGTVDTNSYFAAVKFEQGDFKLVYKYDRNDDNGTPEGTALVSYDKNPAPAAGGALLGGFLQALYTSNNVPLALSATRPDKVANGWVIPRQQRVQGHSLTATWNASDSITVKNILAYRKANVFSPSAIDGVSSLTFTPQAAAGFAPLAAFGVLGTPTGAFLGINTQLDAINAANNPVFMGFVVNPNLGKRTVMIASQAGSIAKQWSDELQVNYTSDRLNATVGAMWFHSDDESGGPVGQQNTLLPFKFLPQTGVIPLGNEGRSFNKATSLAAYAQVEYKVTPEIELVGGIRVTHDKKSSALRYDIVNASGVTTTPSNTITPPDYKGTKASYLAGINWRPAADTLVYFKYSNSFVSGGSTYGIDYAPETASSFELGAKVDLLDRKLRVNLALYHVDYKHLQQSQGTSVPSSRAICEGSLTAKFNAAKASELCSVISTFVYDIGNLRSKGFELEVTAAPTRGLTLGGSLSYSKTTYPFIKPDVLAANGGTYLVTSRPEWTGSAYISYETQPLFNDTTLSMRMDGLYTSMTQVSANSPAFFLYSDSSNRNAYTIPGYMLVNGRIALRHIKIGPVDAEIAGWVKNLTNRKEMSYSLAMGPIATSANFIAPRTFGIDLGIEF